MTDLYKFNKRSNHVQFFKWLWGVDPTYRYKTMCPYFWSYVVTIIILPFLVLVRLFGTWGQDFNGWMLTHKQDKKKRKLEEFKTNLALCKSSKEAYRLKQTKCWKNYGNWDLGWDLVTSINELSKEHSETINQKRYEKEQKAWEIDQKKKALRLARIEKTQAVKDSVVFKYISYTIIGSIGLVLLYGLLTLLYQAFIAISWGWVFKWLGYILLVVIGLAVVFGVLAFIVKYILKPFSEWLECRTFNFDCMLTRGIGNIFTYIGLGFKYIGLMFEYMWSNAIGPVGRGIGHGVLIFFDTLHKIYKKQCPMIAWEE